MSAQAKQRLVNALVSLAKTTRGGYDGLRRGSAVSGGARAPSRRRTVRRRTAGSLGVVNLRSGGALSGGALSGGALSGGRTTRRRRTAGSLGVTNISSGAGLSGGRRKKPTKKRITGGSKWLDFVADYQAKHGVSYSDALREASAPYHQKYKTKRTKRTIKK